MTDEEWQRRDDEQAAAEEAQRKLDRIREKGGTVYPYPKIPENYARMQEEQARIQRELKR